MSTKTSKILTFFTPKTSDGTGAIFMDTGISAGFPSPADDFRETRISLDEEFIQNKEATFFCKSKRTIYDRCWFR